MAQWGKAHTYVCIYAGVTIAVLYTFMHLCVHALTVVVTEVLLETDEQPTHATPRTPVGCAANRRSEHGGVNACSRDERSDRQGSTL